jgi:hypothetical protein
VALYQLSYTPKNDTRLQDDRTGLGRSGTPTIAEAPDGIGGTSAGAGMTQPVTATYPFAVSRARKALLGPCVSDA